MDICLHELREAGDPPGRLALESLLFMAPEGLVDGRDRGCRGSSWRSPWVGTVPVTKKGVLGCGHVTTPRTESSLAPQSHQHADTLSAVPSGWAPPMPHPHQLQGPVTVLLWWWTPTSWLAPLAPCREHPTFLFLRPSGQLLAPSRLSRQATFSEQPSLILSWLRGWGHFWFLSS